MMPLNACLCLIAFSKKDLSKLRKESRPCSARWRCSTSARRRDETSIGTSVSSQPAVIPSPQATRNPPRPPFPYKTGPKLAMRHRGHHTCHSYLPIPPPHPPPAPPHAPHHASTKVSQRRPPITTSPVITTTKTYRAASEFATKLRAAVSFGAFRFSVPPPPPETAGYVSDSPRAGKHSTPVVAIARARPRIFFLVRPTRRAGP